MGVGGRQGVKGEAGWVLGQAGSAGLVLGQAGSVLQVRLGKSTGRFKVRRIISYRTNEIR